MNTSQRLADIRLDLIALSRNAAQTAELQIAFGIYWPHGRVRRVTCVSEARTALDHDPQARRERDVACVLLFLDHQTAGDAERIAVEVEGLADDRPLLVGIPGPTFDGRRHARLLEQLDMTVPAPLMPHDVQQIVARVVRCRSERAAARDDARVKARR